MDQVDQSGARVRWQRTRVLASSPGARLVLMVGGLGSTLLLSSPTSRSRLTRWVQAAGVAGPAYPLSRARLPQQRPPTST